MPDSGVKTVEIFPWNDNFDTGVEEIDAQHRTLVDLLNLLVSHLAFQSDIPTLNAIYDRLRDYTVVHFQTEERIWADYFQGDPWESWHRNSHTDFIEKVVRLKADDSGREPDEVVEDIVSFLTHWLALHILESDKRMAKVVLALPSGISLQQAKQVADDEMSGATRVLIDTVMGMYDKLATRTLHLTREINMRRRAEKELQLARMEAERANQAKSRFLTNMSHEIRTPLNAITGMTHLLKRSGVTPQQAERLDKIETAGHHLLDIVNSILDLSKIEAGKFTLEEADVDLSTVMANAASMLADRARARNLQLIVTPTPRRHALRGDPLRLQQALLNYVANAIKFTERGAVTLRASEQDEGDGHVTIRIEVEDTGIGIPADILPRLFGAFEQADDSTTRKYGGSGLGLAITRRLAELMGGAAGADSTPGAGSTFWFTARLKIRDAAMSRPGTAPVDAETALRRRFAGRRVLVVDDEPLNQELAKLLLEAAELRVDVAEDGSLALEKAGAAAYAAILMDVQMPVMDGLEATRRIRDLPGYGRTPILAMTANAFVEDKARCRDAGMDDILVKPFDPEALFEMVLRWLDRGRA